MIKYIAIISMLLDHINDIVYDHKYFILTFIGRLAFPLFAYLLVKNYLFYTHNKLNYLFRILVFAFISIPFYYYGFGVIIPLNILFTIFFCMFFIYLYEQEKYYYLFFVFMMLFYCDYSVYSLLMFVSFYLFLTQRTFQNIIFLFISIILINPIYFFYTPVLVLMLVMFDYYYKFDFKSVFNKYTFYLFYPLHIFLLGLLK